jgi:hypothetical protein
MRGLGQAFDGLAEGLPWPAGTRVKGSLRRKPEGNHRHPQLHVIHR